ncbi:YcaO-like family protein [Nonomuraea sp. NPDC050643]|uniref:YcaO-like family protein n=1 Tax=Nonomuraea sp. NPDC050643 TaxID=3155660 RepID=UPI0033ED0D40
MGPDLSLVKVTVPNGVTITRMIAESPGAGAGFLETRAPDDDDVPPRRENAAVTGVVIRADGMPYRECADLCRRLSAEGAGHWVTVARGEPLPTAGPPPLIVVAAHRTSAPDGMTRPRGDGRVLRIGESFEGTFVTGPDDGRDLAPPRWAFETRLAALGFTERPLPILHRMRTDPAGLARAITLAAKLGPEEAVLVSGLRTVAFGTPEAVAATPFGEIPRSQAWTFGMARGFRVRPGAIRGSHVASCRTPAGGQDHLEGNSGKGVTAQAAIAGAVGEALERYAACEANRSLPPSGDTTRRLDLARFHPYGPPWEGRRPPVVYVDGIDLADGTTVAVPKALVVFPYLGADRPTYGITTGLAAGPDVADATLRGLREVLERDGLYTGFTHLLPARRLDPGAALARLNLTGAFDGEIWALHWPREGHVLPDVHAFHHGAGLLVRASGSGLTFDDALDGALIELCQVHLEAVRARRTGTSTSPAHTRWARPDVIAQARRYLDGHRLGDPPAVPYGDPRSQLDHLVARTRPVVVRLPLRGPDWAVVRVLVPGATTSPYPSDSRGGRRLLNAPWTHGIPT